VLIASRQFHHYVEGFSKLWDFQVLCKVIKVLVIGVMFYEFYEFWSVFCLVVVIICQEEQIVLFIVLE